MNQGQPAIFPTYIASSLNDELECLRQFNTLLSMFNVHTQNETIAANAHYESVIRAKLI
jgi:hypothetical protein